MAKFIVTENGIMIHSTKGKNDAFPFRLHRGLTADGSVLAVAATIDEARALYDADEREHRGLQRVVCNTEGQAVWLDAMAGEPGTPVEDSEP